MRNLNRSGQALIEVALVLPVFCLGIFVGLQLIWLCHNLIELQRMAQFAASAVTLNNYQNNSSYSFLNSLEGRIMPPVKDPLVSHIPENWHPFKGVETVQDAGRIVELHLHTTLLPDSGFTRDLPMVREEGSGIQFLEPPVRSGN